MRWTPVVLLVLGCGLLAGCAGAPVRSASPGPAPSATAPQGAGRCSPSTRVDGFSDALDKTRFQGRFVGNLSGLATEPDGRVLALSDRSLLFTLDATTRRPVSVVPLADERGDQLDSEALVREPDGTLLVTSETEPSVRHYTVDGRLLDRLPVPPELGVPGVLSLGSAGRASRNLTFEGLALLPDGRLVASMEAPLRGDQGNLVRLQTWVRDGAGWRPDAQWALTLDQLLGVSELTSTGDGRLLVLQRGYLPGLGNTVRLYLADPRGAADVSRTPRLDASTRPVARTLLADLADCPSLGAPAKEHQVNPLLDNIEGMTITGRDPDGTLHLLLVSDDNASAKQTTRLYRLAVTLPG
jgi:hypothetical protein